MTNKDNRVNSIHIERHPLIVSCFYTPKIRHAYNDYNITSTWQNPEHHCCFEINNVKIKIQGELQHSQNLGNCLRFQYYFTLDNLKRIQKPYVRLIQLVFFRFSDHYILFSFYFIVLCFYKTFLWYLNNSYKYFCLKALTNKKAYLRRIYFLFLCISS